MKKKNNYERRYSKSTEGNRDFAMVRVYMNRVTKQYKCKQ